MIHFNAEMLTFNLILKTSYYAFQVDEKNHLVHLSQHMDDPEQPFRVVLCYRLTPEHDIIERWRELENRGNVPVSIEVCSFGTLHLPNGTTELTSVAVVWAREFITRRERLSLGTRVLGGAKQNVGYSRTLYLKQI